MQPKAGLIDLLTYIVRQPIPTLKDEPEHRITWSGSFKYFIECWYVSAPLLFSILAFYLIWENLLTDSPSLEKEASRRATPWRMLEHPWMVEMKDKNVNMEHFLVQVWDWKD